MSKRVFSDDFLIALRTYVNVHHSIYHALPPQGIYFHFDGADGKCQVRRLDIERCNTLLEWDLKYRRD